MDYLNIREMVSDLLANCPHELYGYHDYESFVEAITDNLRRVKVENPLSHIHDIDEAIRKADRVEGVKMYETLIELLKAQDIVRRLWANATDSEIEK